MAEHRGDRLLWSVAEHLPFLHPVVVWRERKLATAECAAMLEICRRLQAEDSALEGERLYARAIMSRLSCDEVAARGVVHLADQSFAQWPEERDVNFRDVVNYMIVNRILSAHARALGARADVEKVVAAAIPIGL